MKIIIFILLILSGCEFLTGDQTIFNQITEKFITGKSHSFEIDFELQANSELKLTFFGNADSGVEVILSRDAANAIQIELVQGTLSTGSDTVYNAAPGQTQFNWIIEIHNDHQRLELYLFQQGETTFNQGTALYFSEDTILFGTEPWARALPGSGNTYGITSQTSGARLIRLSDPLPPKIKH